MSWRGRQSAFKSLVSVWSLLSNVVPMSCGLIEVRVEDFVLKGRGKCKNIDGGGLSERSTKA